MGVFRSGKFLLASIAFRQNYVESLRREAGEKPGYPVTVETAAPRVAAEAGKAVWAAIERTPPPIRADLVLLESQPMISEPPETSSPSEEEDTLYLDALPAVQGVAFLESTIPDTTEVSKRTEIYTYTVEPGDTPAGIASLFGVSLNTLLWENKLSMWGVIRPGDKLVILPATGISHKVAAGETVASIAKKYSANTDDIIAFNNLSADSALAAGETIIVPDGIPPALPKPRIPRVEVVRDNNPPGWLVQPAPGRNWGRRHGFNGVDIANSCGTPIIAAAAGTVIVADAVGWNGGYGRYVKIQHSNGVVTLYAHNRELLVENGVWINQGDAIALMGSTGRSTGCHAHFEVRGARNPFVWR